MVLYLKDEMDPINKVQINIHSDAYIGGVPTFIKLNPNNYVSKLADVHIMMIRTRHVADIKNVKYAFIPDAYLVELVKLHREWFPINYNKDYFKKFIYKKNYLAIGAFITLFSGDYLIGCALGEVCNESKFRKNVKNVLKEKSWFNFFESNEKCGYLNTIGVIDEYRYMGVGSKLLDHFINEMKKKDCIAVYLHVIEHNKSAIKFYEKNKWNQGEVIDKYYHIDDKFYDAITFYNIIDDKGFRSAKIKVNIPSIPDSQIARKGCIQSFVGKVKGICLCKKKKENYEIVI